MKPLFISLVLSALLLGSVQAFDSQREGKLRSDDTGPVTVKLTKRKDNGPYGTAAYSLRYASQSIEAHRNHVDLVYNGCGLLHINPHAGMQSRIADLGKRKLDEVSKAPKKGWHQDCIEPRPGHVYVQQVNDGQQQFVVKFRITKLSVNAMELEWTYLNDARNPKKSTRPRSRVGAGTMGQCGGRHQER